MHACVHVTIIGASLSEPHTSRSSYIDIYIYIYRYVNRNSQINEWTTENVKISFYQKLPKKNQTCTPDRAKDC